MSGCKDPFVQLPAGAATGAGDGGVAISAGSQSASTGTIVFSNSNGVTFGMSGSSVVTASVAGATPGAISAGTASVALGTAVFSNSNNLSFGLAGSTITASASFSTTPETPFGLSAGTQSVSTGTAIFSNSNNVSFGMAGSRTITASASFPPETPFALSAGTQSVSTGTVVFSNANSISFGMAGSNAITASFSTAPETPFAISAGTQSVSTGTVRLSNANGISFGMAGSNTVTASYASYLSMFANVDLNENLGFTNGFEILTPMIVPGYISATQQVVLLSLTGATNSTGSMNISIGIYTISGLTASLASSVFRGISWTSGSGGASTASNFYGGVLGPRWRTLGGVFNLTPGAYLLGYNIATTNDGAWNYGAQGGNLSVTGVFDGAESGANAVWLPGASITGGLVGSINVTEAGYNRTIRFNVPCVSMFGTF